MKKSKITAMCTALIMLLTSAGISGVSAQSKYNGLIVESLYFTDDNGMVITEPAGARDVYPNVCVQKNESSTPFDGKLIVAVYDDRGLAGINSFAVGEDTTVSGETVFGFDRTVFRGPKMDMPQNSKAKIFYWDSEENMTPYGAPAEAVPAFENQYYGEIQFPSPFKELIDGKFTISKVEGARKYEHTATPYNIYDWSDATEIFLSSSANYLSASVKDELGIDRTKPITGRNFATHYKEGAYKNAAGEKQTKFIFTLLNDFYSGNKNATGANVHSIPLTNYGTNSNLNLGAGEKIDALIRSGSESGFTWIGTLYNQDDTSAISQKWTLLDGYQNVYNTVKTMTCNVVTLYDFKTVDAYGVPKPYVLVNSIDEVAATEGTFYQSGNNIYCNPRTGDELNDIALAAEDSYFSGIRHQAAYSSQTIMFENIGFMPRPTGHIANQFFGQDYDKAIFGFFGCKFSGGAQNTVGINGRYTCYMVDSVAAYGFRDGFNYHGQEGDSGIATIDTDGQSSTVIELNCISYMVGDYNRVYGSSKVSPGSTNNSNNASTVHDNMKCLRVGGRYWGCQGPIIGDGAFDITMGCEAYDINTTPSDKIGFNITSGLLNTYLIDCYATGTKMRAGYCGNKNSYALDLCGNTRFGNGSSGNIIEPKQFSWENIKNGVWNTIDTMTVDGMKNEYSIGEDLDLTRGTLKIAYDNGETGEVALSDSSVKIIGFDSQTAGEKTLKVCYKSLVTKTNVTVVEREIKNIALSGIKTEYTVGEDFDASTGVLTVTYSDDTTEEIALSNAGITVTGFDTTEAGTKTITFTYRDRTVTADINVRERTLTSFTLSDIKTEYIVGEEIDRSAGKLILAYDNGTSSEIAFANDAVNVSGFDTSAAGTVTITVTYMGISVNADIVVSDKEIKTHYNAYEDTSDTQGTNCWYYRYAPVGKFALSDYSDYTYSNGVWSLDGKFTHGRIRMLSNIQVLEAGNIGDSALTFKAPMSGTIKVSTDGVITDNSDSKDIERLRIYHNDKQIFPATEGEWLTIEGKGGSYNETYGTSYPREYKLEPISLKVSEGDVIIFRVNKGSDSTANNNPEHANNEGDKLHCIPVIDYVTTGGGSGEDPEPPQDDIVPTVKQVFKFSEDYSDNQGENNWYYMNAPYKSNEYSLMPMYEKYAYYSASGWKYASNKWTYGIINANYTSTGFERDPVLAFRAPVTGDIKISMADGLKNTYPESGNADGMLFNIYKQASDSTRTKLFPQGSEEFYEIPYAAGQTVTTAFDPISLSVNAGDYIYFRVNCNANSANDNLWYNPIIEYTSDVGVYLNDIYCMLDIEDGVPVSQKLTYSANADSISWTSSDEEVVTVSEDGTVTPVAPGSAYVTLSATVGDTTYTTQTKIDVVNKKNPTPFADGDVIGMWGDSLTHGGEYGERIEEFYAAKYPNITINMPKFGYSGDDTIDILKRVDRDAKTRTDINRATILLGANDFALTPDKIDSATDTYTKRMTAIIGKLKAQGITDITLITPTPFDAIRSGNNLRAGLMKEYSFELRQIASDENCAIVDAWSVMDAYDKKLKEGHEISASMPSLMSDDNLHPNDMGYMVLAYSILKAQGALLSDADKAEVEISSLNGGSVVSSKNSNVSGLTADETTVSFNYTPDRLIYPQTSGYTGFLGLETAADGEFADGNIIKVTNLEGDAVYELKVNDTLIGEYTGAELSEGVDIAACESALKSLSDKITAAADLIDTYDDSLINILNFETRYLKTTDVISAEEGVALANQKVSDGSLNAGSANAYITWKNSEGSWRNKLAAAWNDMYTAVRNKTFSIKLIKK